MAQGKQQMKLEVDFGKFNCSFPNPLLHPLSSLVDIRSLLTLLSLRALLVPHSLATSDLAEAALFTMCIR